MVMSDEDFMLKMLAVVHAGARSEPDAVVALVATMPESDVRGMLLKILLMNLELFAEGVREFTGAATREDLLEVAETAWREIMEKGLSED